MYSEAHACPPGGFVLRTGGRHCHLQLQGAALQALLGLGSAVKEKNLVLLHAAVSADDSAYQHHITILILAATKLVHLQLRQALHMCHEHP